MKALLKLSLINCGYITEYLATKYLKISKSYLNSLVNKKLLIKENYILFGKNTTIFTFSEKYLNKLKNDGYFIYKSDTSQLEHDYILNKIFLKLPDNIKYTWKNETELKSKFGKKITTTDALIIRDNKLIAIEILTASYTKENINAKMDFIKNFCDDQIILNLKDFNWR